MAVKKENIFKVFVEVDISQPFPRGTLVKSNRESRWVTFKYEKYPDFCHKCGVIGHAKRNYKETSTSQEARKGFQFRSWMRANSGVNSSGIGSRKESKKHQGAKWYASESELVEKEASNSTGTKNNEMVRLRTSLKIIKEDATVGNDTIVREFIANTHKLTCTVVQLHPAQPLDLANWLLEPDAPSWHFGPLANDEYGSGSEKSEDEYADHAADDEVGPSGRS
ncbi:hypothetical protein ACH5RR_018024 [Cinchona calisaya]|uniref:Zinc knuckle CX2CX4HX4C domain-containing protein n=1 Tax=Cinchona calisaya TaxID=153742 RepID=A0ABD2ZK97_9GENT